MREPLSRWIDYDLAGDSRILPCRYATIMCGGNRNTYFSVTLRGQVSGESGAPRIAAEDVARAMVADMAAELGGSVTWPTEGGSE
jgi:hypothetical protein